MASSNEKYQLAPPEGGWGYIIVLALTIMISTTIIPMTSFGLIFGDFLSKIGDETSGTTLVTLIFNTVLNFTGLLSSNLLQKYSYRFVALIGGILFFIGSFSTIFVTNLLQMMVSFGLLQGLGMGLMLPAHFTALNFYFDKKLSLMNNVSQVFMVLASIVFPFLTQWAKAELGFRGTVALISALSLNTISAALALQPVSWHSKKVPIAPELVEFLEEGEKYVSSKPRASIISIGDRAASVTTLNKSNNFFKSLELFKDPIYLNISLGLSLGFTADVAFISIIPAILNSVGFDSNTIAFLISVFFGSDLIARIIISVLSVVVPIKNRYYFLGSSFLLIIFRIAFVLRNDYYWKLITISILGFLRCFIQTPLPLVISEQYSEQFATAFSLYMVVCGVVCLIFGPLMSFVKTYTGSDVMVVHLLSLAYLIVFLSWTLELVLLKMRKKEIK